MISGRLRSDVPLARLIAWLPPPPDDALRAACEASVARTSLSPRARDRVIAALIAARRPDQRIEGLFRLGPPPARPFVAHLRRTGAIGLAASLVLAGAGQATLWLASWWFVAQWIGAGASRTGWFAGWILTVVSAMGLRLLAMDLASRVTLALGAAVQERALVGATRLPFAALHGQGIGALLGRVFERLTLEQDGLLGCQAFGERGVVGQRTGAGGDQLPLAGDGDRLRGERRRDVPRREHVVSRARACSGARLHRADRDWRTLTAARPAW